MGGTARRSVAIATWMAELVQPVKSAGHGVMADEELACLAAAGDLQAFEELVRRHQRGIYTIIYNMTGNRADTDDLVQETFIRAYRSIRSFKRRSRFFTWLYRIAMNLTLSHLRKKSQNHDLDLNELSPDAAQDALISRLVDPTTPDREARLRELQRRLNEAMQRLTPIHRMVVTLFDVQGLSHEEIAKIMGCKVGTVRSRLFYARQQLQAYLSDLID